MPIRSAVYRAVQCVLIAAMVLAGVGVAFPLSNNDITVELYYDSAWNVITTDVRVADGISITRGRGDEATRCDPGRAILTINNSTGKYSPRNPNSVLYGKIGRNTPIRISVTYDAVTYIRFVGEVSSWPSRWDLSESDKWVPIEAYGIFRRLGQGAAPLNSPWYRFIKGSAPLAWWPLEAGDQRETVSTPSGLAGGSPLQALPSFWVTEYAQRKSGVVGGAIVGPPGAPVAIDLSGHGRLFGHLPTASATATWRIEIGMLITTPVDTATDFGEVFRVAFGDEQLVILAGNSGAGINTTLAFIDSAGPPADSAVIIDDGVWHHLRVDLSSSGGGADTAYTLAIDGVVALTGTATGVGFSNPTSVTVSGFGDLGGASHVAFWSGALPATLDGYEAFTGHAGEQAHERLQRLCDEEGISIVITGSRSALMGPQRVATLLDLLEDSAITDRGFLYEQRTVVGVAYRTNASRFTQ